MVSFDAVDANALALLQRFDTPTICNALELIDPQRRSFGYTDSTLHCLNANCTPRVGVAFTATMRSEWPPERAEGSLKEHRLTYYEYMSTDVGAPKICVMQDLDGLRAGRGPFWGEFNTRIHRALGFSAVITDGSVRDVTKLPTDILLLSRGLRPSHAHVHIVSFGSQVNVFGMSVKHGDIVHADQHGAVAFPHSFATRLATLSEEYVASEAPILDACKTDRLTIAELRRLYLQRTRSSSG